MQQTARIAFQKAGVATSAKQGRRQAVVVRAQNQEVDRRQALGLLAGAAALVSAQPSEAAYGEAARVFASKPTNPTGFTPYAGEGFALLIPSKWGPSKERDFPNVVFRYEDSFDAVNNIMVIVEPVGGSSIDSLGSPDKFLADRAYLFGETAAFTGESKSEGGFAPNKFAANSILDVSEATDKKGRKYYKYQVLARTADNDEGGRHHLIAATVADGKLYLLKVQAGDKRWARGERRNAETTWNSFTVA